ncbi:MAG: hypothetical protein AAF497_19700, partial [Planctomycetota bacterium]
MQSTTNAIRMWEPRTGLQHFSFVAHDNPTSCAISSDGRQVVTSGADRLVKKWSLHARDNSSFIVNHLGFIESLDFNSDDSKLVMACSPNRDSAGMGKKQGRIWQLAKGDNELKEVAILKGFNEWIRDIQFGEDDLNVFGIGNEGGVCCWDAQTSKIVWSQQQAHSGEGTCLALSADNGIYTGGSSGEIQIRNAQGDLAKRWQAHDSAIAGIELLESLGLILSADKGSLRLWEMTTGNQVAEYVMPEDARIRQVAVSPTEPLIATGTDDGVVYLLRLSSTDVSSPQYQLQTICKLSGHSDAITGLDFHPNGERMASVSMDRSVVVWSVVSQEIALRLEPAGQNNNVLAVAFSSSGDQLAAARAFEVTVWDGSTLPNHGSTRINAGASLPEKVAWHRRQVGLCRREGNWFGAAFHYSRLLELEPDNREWVAGRCGAYARMGEYFEALQDSTTLCETEDADISDYLPHAVMLLLNNKHESYVNLCQRVVSEADWESMDRLAVNHHAWMCSVGPDSLADYAPLIHLVRGFTTDLQLRRRGGFLSALAALYLRAGRHQEAIDTTWERLETIGQIDSPYDWLVLAMAHIQLGQPNEARYWYDRATVLISPNAPPSTTNRQWRSELELRLLLKEVESELFADTGDQTQSNIVDSIRSRTERIRWNRKQFQKELQSCNRLAAEEHLNRWIQLDPKNHLPLLHRSRLLATDGDASRAPDILQSAKVDYQSAVELAGGLLLNGNGLHLQVPKIEFAGLHEFTIEA